MPPQTYHANDKGTGRQGHTRSYRHRPSDAGVGPEPAISSLPFGQARRVDVSPERSADDAVEHPYDHTRGSNHPDREFRGPRCWWRGYHRVAKHQVTGERENDRGLDRRIHQTNDPEPVHDTDRQPGRGLRRPYTWRVLGH